MTPPERTQATCDCRPAMDGSGVRHELDCASRRPRVPAPSDEALIRMASGARAVDLPRLLAEARAEGQAARTAEIVAWLREELRLALSHGNHDHAAIRRLEARFSDHFNPGAER